MKTTLLLVSLCFGSIAQIPFNAVPKYLDKNQVKARINTVNNKFWNIAGNGKNAYEVPVGKGANAQFANSIWIAGYDGGGQLHLSANTYRQLGTDFWAGPLDTTNFGAFNTSNSAVYNKLWKVDCNDINAFVNAYNSGSVSANTYTIPPDLLAYPAKGIANFQSNLEPFYDANHNGLYNPQTEGDYPIIKGQQQILSIYNDNYATHGETGMPPMGLEIHERSYAYSDPNLPDSLQAINYSTFYHYTIYNRSNTNYSNVLITDWEDVDLGYYLDDYIGCDTANGFAYCYNSNPIDPTASGVKGYGNHPPVVSEAILFTDCSHDGIDNNNNGTIDEAGETFIMNGASYYNNNIAIYSPQTTNPSTGIDYYHYMNSVWKNASHFTYGGNAFGGTVPTNFVYTGDPSVNTGWTEASAGNPGGDRRILLTSGPFNFPAHSKIEWGYAVIFSQDTTMVVNTISEFVKRVRTDVRETMKYDKNHQAPFCTPAITAGPNYAGISNTSFSALKIMVYPNPAHNRVIVDLMENAKSAQVKLIDITGRKVMEQQINEGYRASFDVNALDAGVYYVEVECGNRKTVEKIIKN